MNTLRMLGLITLMAVMVPAAASATHLNGIDAAADCSGWNATLDVTWRTGVYEGTLDYSVRLLDLAENVLFEDTWTGLITRETTDPRDMMYTFNGIWQGVFSGPAFLARGDFHLVAPYSSGIDEETISFDLDLQCTVSSEEATWGAVKSLYR
ncbi:MAG: hypothetical protein R6X25_04345 [Candidatus Krumholzibacteriia bacterium]